MPTSNNSAAAAPPRLAFGSSKESSNAHNRSPWTVAAEEPEPEDAPTQWLLDRLWKIARQACSKDGAGLRRLSRAAFADSERHTHCTSGCGRMAGPDNPLLWFTLRSVDDHRHLCRRCHDHVLGLTKALDHCRSYSRTEQEILGGRRQNDDDDGADRTPQ